MQVTQPKVDEKQRNDENTNFKLVQSRHKVFASFLCKLNFKLTPFFMTNCKINHAGGWCSQMFMRYNKMMETQISGGFNPDTKCFHHFFVKSILS